MKEIILENATNKQFMSILLMCERYFETPFDTDYRTKIFPKTQVNTSDPVSKEKINIIKKRCKNDKIRIEVKQK